MANFAPMRDRLLFVLQDNLELFGIHGRFLDYGAGPGDVSNFLLERCGMPAGVAYDPAFAHESLRAAGEDHPALVRTAQRQALTGEYDFAILFDVIEHLPDAPAALGEVRRQLRDDGWLALTVPYNAHEWGSDDDFYGHLRRLSRRGIITLLEKSGWSVIRVLDPSFPTFWLIRRVYLLARRLGGSPLGLVPIAPSADAAAAPAAPAALRSAADDMQRSLESPHHTPWKPTGLLVRLLSTSLVPWNVVRRLDLYFESLFWGFELFVLCQKRDSDAPAICEVCEHGSYSFHRFFDRYSLQKCSYCGSERILPESPVHLGVPGDEKQLPVTLRSVLQSARRSRVRLIERCAVPERSILDLRCGDGALLQALAARGWRTVGTASSDQAATPARAAGIEVITGGVLDVPRDAPFGMIHLFHVIEHTDNLGRTLARLDELLLPGGFLILEYPNGASLLKAMLGWRWFGYDPPHHRLQVNPTYLADRLGLANYRLVRESHFSPEYSFFIFAQSWTNWLLPFQRDALYRTLCGHGSGALDAISAALSVALFALLLVLFVIYQPLVSLLRRGCVVRQVFKKTDIAAPSPPA